MLSDFDTALAPLSITVGCDFSWLEDCGPLPWDLAVHHSMLSMTLQIIVQAPGTVRINRGIQCSLYS